MPGPGAFFVGKEERDEVAEVMESGYLSRYGSDTDKRFKQKVLILEDNIARLTGTHYCLAVSGGTGALMASLVALGVGPGVEVLVPGYTFVASISAIIAVGGIPILTEIDESFNMDPDDVEQKITDNSKVVMPVHMLGNPADMDKIIKIAEKHHLLVLEDCCQAFGAKYKGRFVGSIGTIGAFSLNINKTITCGDGGLVVTNNKTYYERAFAFHDQGHMPRRLGAEIGKRSLIGINLRMNELTAAFAIGQLKRLDSILKLLHDKKARIKNALADAGIEGMRFRKINDTEECATILTVIFKKKELAKKIAAKLKTKTVSESGWHVYNNMEQILAITDESGNKRYRKHMLPRTDDILERSINLSIGVVDPGLGAGFGVNILSTEEDIDETVKQFVEVVKRYSS